MYWMHFTRTPPSKSPSRELVTPTGMVQRGRYALAMLAVVIAIPFPSAAHAQSGAQQDSTTRIPFGGRRYVLELNPEQLALDDLNKDGLADVVAAAGNTAQVLLASRPGFLGPATGFHIENNPRSLDLADLNGDQHLDIVVAKQAADAISVLLGDGIGGFSSRTLFPLVSPPAGGSLGDLNGDGFLDMVTTGFGSAGTVAVSLGTGTGGFQLPFEFIANGTNLHGVNVGDVDLNGKLDVVFTNNIPAVGRHASVMFGDGSGALGAAADHRVAAGAEAIQLADLDNDGVLDVVTANVTTSTVSILKGTGGGIFAPAVHFSTGLQPASVEIADLDGDGRLDAVTANKTSNDLSVLRGSGDTSFLPFERVPGRPGPEGVLDARIADMNNDGRADIVSANFQDKSVSLMLNQDFCNSPAVGEGCAGTGGHVPVLGLSDCPFAGNSVTLTVTHALGGSMALLFAGADTADISIGGGCSLFIQPPLSSALEVPLDGSGPGAGSLKLPFSIPPAIPSGSTAAVQAFVLDPGGNPRGFSSSNGILITFQ